MLEKIGEILIRAVNDLFLQQCNILESTTETTMTEWNFAHHYAICLSKYFPIFDCDTDLIKRNFDMKRPDIILHTRKTNKNNFLVIEIKLKSGIDYHDELKIESEWFQSPLQYRYGACLSVKDNNCSVKIIKNDDNKESIERTITIRMGEKIGIREFADKEIVNFLNNND